MGAYAFKGYAPGPGGGVSERAIAAEGRSLADALGNAWKGNMDCFEIVPAEETAEAPAAASPIARGREDPCAAISELAAALGCGRRFASLEDASAWIEDRFNLWIWLQPRFAKGNRIFWRCMAASEKCPEALALSLMPARQGALADGLSHLLRGLLRHGGLAGMAGAAPEMPPPSQETACKN